MKQVFQCDYCNFMGTEEKVKAHESTCLDNYNLKSCTTCKHRSIQSIVQFKCACGKEIPKNSVIEYCEKYERTEKKNNYDLGDIFGSVFGGVK